MIKNSLVYVSKKILSKNALKFGIGAFNKSLGFISLTASGISSFQMYRTYLKNDPHNEIIWPMEEKLKEEMEKWDKAIDYIGRDSYQVGNVCTFMEGGAINALGKRELFCIPNSRYDFHGKKLEYHLPPIKKPKQDSKETLEETVDLGNRFHGTMDPCSDRAKSLISKSINYIQETKEFNIVPNFSLRKNQLIKRFTGVIENMKTDSDIKINYAPDQAKLYEIVSQVLDIRNEIYDSQISIIKKEKKARNKKRGKYALIAVGSFALGNVGKIKPKK